MIGEGSYSYICVHKHWKQLISKDISNAEDECIIIHLPRPLTINDYTVYTRPSDHGLMLSFVSFIKRNYCILIRVRVV
jgi:hypothetical protein